MPKAGGDRSSRTFGTKIMRPEDFRLRLDAASFYATQFASTMVTDALPYKFRYCVLLNISCDDNREPDEEVFPEDDGILQEDIEADGVVRLLCRGLRVPQWIDIAVGFALSSHSQLVLTCCGRFHSDDERLYYYSQGTQPFGIKSPALPPHHKDGERFQLPRREDFYFRLRQFYQIEK